MNKMHALMNRKHCAPTGPGLFFGILLTALLSGCTGDLLTQNHIPPAIYLLQDSGSHAAQFNPTGPTLSINPVRAAPGYDSTDMIYVKQAYRLQAFSRHRWADSPAHMLEPLLVAMAERSTLFAGVTEPGNYVQTSLRLDSELLQLQQVFSATGSSVELTLRTSLIDMRRGTIMASRVFRLSEPATEATPYGGVLAANRATTQLMLDIQAFIRHTMAAGI